MVVDFGQRYPCVEQLRPGARFAKVPTLFGRISGDIVFLVFSKPMHLEARNFVLNLIFIPFTTYEKTNLTEFNAGQFYEWLFGPEKSSGLSRNGPQIFKLISSLVKGY